MSQGREGNYLFSRVSLIGASLTLIEIPNSILYLHGYGTALTILAESVILLFGILTLAFALISRESRLPSYQASMAILLILGFALQYSVQALNSGNTTLEFLSSLALFVCSFFLIWAVGYRHFNMEKKWFRVTFLLSIGAIAALFLYFSSSGLPYFNSDESALDAYSALLATHGINPYLSDLSRAFAQYNTPIEYLTPTLNGGYV
ncbi:MAG: hypothetical protein QW812_06375, partial [Thermoplasmataceae archaeon]